VIDLAKSTDQSNGGGNNLARLAQALLFNAMLKKVVEPQSKEHKVDKHKKEFDKAEGLLLKISEPSRLNSGECYRSLKISKETLHVWLTERPYDYHGGYMPTMQRVLSWAKTLSDGRHVDIQIL